MSSAVSPTRSPVDPVAVSTSPGRIQHLDQSAATDPSKPWGLSLAGSRWSKSMQTGGNLRPQSRQGALAEPGDYLAPVAFGFGPGPPPAGPSSGASGGVDTSRQAWHGLCSPGRWNLADDPAARFSCDPLYTTEKIMSWIAEFSVVP